MTRLRGRLYLLTWALQDWTAADAPGGFTLDGLGGWYIDGVKGDPSAVIGIGLPLTRRLLELAGLSISDLWQANPVTS